MNSENKFTIIGRLTKDPILRETERGTKVTNICVACEREYKGKDGNNISKQGSLIYLEGYNITKNFGTEKEPIKALNPVVTSYKHLAYSLSSKEENKETSIEVEK